MERGDRWGEEVGKRWKGERSVRPNDTTRPKASPHLGLDEGRGEDHLAAQLEVPLLPQPAGVIVPSRMVAVRCGGVRGRGRDEKQTACDVPIANDEKVVRGGGKMNKHDATYSSVSGGSMGWSGPFWKSSTAHRERR